LRRQGAPSPTRSGSAIAEQSHHLAGKNWNHPHHRSDSATELLIFAPSPGRF
ncbi:hypothetical protein Dimus_031550, partial [Dionaea muscipula]